MNSALLLHPTGPWSQQATHVKWGAAIAVTFGVALFTTIALTNIAVLGLLLVAPFAWRFFRQSQQTLEPGARIFLGLILALAAWDVFSNVMAGHSFGLALKSLLRELRTLVFVVVLWAIFANPHVARRALYAMVLTVVFLASINLVLTLMGLVPQGQYFTTGRLSDLANLYGQALVGVVFVLAQVWVTRPQLSWRVGVPIALLVLSLFLASQRRTGWLLLVAGLALWALLNAKRIFVGKYRWWVLMALPVLGLVIFNYNVVQTRMEAALAEFMQFWHMTPQERAISANGAVSLRLQYFVTAWEIFKNTSWWVGTGSIDLPTTYQAAAAKLGVTQATWALYNWKNPHNEYLFMLVTKGVVGLALYLAIFAQACRMAWKKQDEVQRVGLVMFVFLFMLSITANSMVIDMAAGHLVLLVLLIFLAPKSLNLARPVASPHQP